MFRKVKAESAKIIGLVLLLALVLSSANQVNATQDPNRRIAIDSTKGKEQADFDPVDLAEQVSAGVISEKQFLELNLSEYQILRVFKELANKRGWKADDNILAEIARDIKQNPVVPAEIASASTASSSRCDEAIEMQEGWSNLVYPYRYTRPISGESCGNGSGDGALPDRVLEYSLSRRPANPQSVRWWSNQWFVRRALQTLFGGVLGSNGFCKNTLRICIGSRAFFFLSPWDLMTVYVWWPR